MTQNLTESLIDLRGFGFAPQGNSKLCLDLMERRFNIRALVVMRHELLGVVAVQVVHLLPKSRATLPDVLRSAVALKRNVRPSVVVYYRLEIRIREVGFVRAHFLHYKFLAVVSTKSANWGLLG